MLILGLAAIIFIYHFLTGKKIIEGLNGDDSKEDETEQATIGVDLVGNPEKIVREPEKPKEPDTTFKPEPAAPVPKIQCDPPVIIKGQKCPPQKVVTDKQYCYNSPRYGPPKDPNAGLITTCTNLVKSHVNKCSASAAGLMTRAFGPTITKGDTHQHATDSQLLGFLKRMEAKLRSMTEKKKVTDKAIKLAPKFAPKFEYPKRRGLSYDEYNMWRNVLTKGGVPDSAPDSAPDSKDGAVASASSGNGRDRRDIKIYVTDNRVVKGKNGNGQGGNGPNGQGGNGPNGQGGNGDQGASNGQPHDGDSGGGNSGPLKGSFVQGGKVFEAYNHDDYV